MRVSIRWEMVHRVAILHSWPGADRCAACARLVVRVRGARCRVFGHVPSAMFHRYFETGEVGAGNRGPMDVSQYGARSGWWRADVGVAGPQTGAPSSTRSTRRVLTKSLINAIIGASWATRLDEHLTDATAHARALRPLSLSRPLGCRSGDVHLSDDIPAPATAGPRQKSLQGGEHHASTDAGRSAAN